MKVKDIVEAYSIGSMPNISHQEYQTSYGPLIQKSVKVTDVRNNLELYCCSGKIYLLVKDGSVVLGNLNLSNVSIADTNYYHVDAIFVDPEYRKTSATYWLIYSVKEIVDRPVIADGAIFADGQSLISAIQKHKYLNVGIIDVHTGHVEPLDDTKINSSDHAYIFSTSNVGFGKNMFEGTAIPYVWYPLFEEIL